MLRSARNILFILAAGLVSCSKITPYRSAPVIAHRSLTYTAEVQAEDPIFIESPRDTINMVRLSFELLDGNGDIGRADSTDTATDTIAPGIHLWLYIPAGATMVPSHDTAFRYLYYQMPEIEAYSTTGQIKADVDIAVNSYRSNIFPYDTIAYRYYVVDKSGNRSNTLFTEKTVLVK